MYTMMSVILLMIKEKCLAKFLWNEIANAVVYVKNYYPNIEDKTVFKKYNKEPSDIFNLRVLGCRA